MFDTNVIGLIRVTQAALPLLGEVGQPGRRKRLERTWLVLGRDQSRATPISLSLNYVWLEQGRRVDAHCPVRQDTARDQVQRVVEPGFTATDLTPFSGACEPVEIGAEAIVRMATIGKDGPTGTFQEGDVELGW